MPGTKLGIKPFEVAHLGAGGVAGVLAGTKIDKKREKVSSGSESRKRWGKCLKIGGPGPSKTIVFH